MADEIVAFDEVLSADRSSFIGMLVGFGEELRLAGLAVGSGDLLTYCAAMALLDPADVVDLYWAGRTSLITRREHIPVYDRVFHTYFLDYPVDAARTGKGRPEAVAHREPIRDRGSGRRAGPAGQGGRGPNGVDGLRHRDLAQQGVRRLHRRRARCPAPDHERGQGDPAPTKITALGAGSIRSKPDLRRTVRTTMRTHGEPAELFWRERRLKMRPLVLILDVSGSMAEYSRNLLQFAYSTRRAATKVEVFCFGTRLTRITRALERRRPDDALDQAAKSVFDWEGGTRIGQAIDTFVRQWGRRGMSRGAIVVICSDGLDRGDPPVGRGDGAAVPPVPQGRLDEPPQGQQPRIRAQHPRHDGGRPLCRPPVVWA